MFTFLPNFKIILVCSEGFVASCSALGALEAFNLRFYGQNELIFFQQSLMGQRFDLYL